MSRFAWSNNTFNYLPCDVHGPYNMIGVSSKIDSLDWTQYCEECAANIIRKQLTPLIYIPDQDEKYQQGFQAGLKIGAAQKKKVCR